MGVISYLEPKTLGQKELAEVRPSAFVTMRRLTLHTQAVVTDELRGTGSREVAILVGAHWQSPTSKADSYWPTATGGRPAWQYIAQARGLSVAVVLTLWWGWGWGGSASIAAISPFLLAEHIRSDSHPWSQLSSRW